MSKLYVIAEVKLQAGKSGEFKALAAIYNQIVKEKDKETLLYEFFLNDDESVATAVESYASSEAALAHLGNLGAELGKLLAIGELSLTIMGQPSAQLVQALQGLSSRVFPKFIYGIA